jgi:DNA-directed RNA polymerase specialized sigma24 family protein
MTDIQIINKYKTTQDKIYILKLAEKYHNYIIYQINTIYKKYEGYTCTDLNELHSFIYDIVFVSMQQYINKNSTEYEFGSFLYYNCKKEINRYLSRYSYNKIKETDLEIKVEAYVLDEDNTDYDAIKKCVKLELAKVKDIDLRKIINYRFRGLDNEIIAKKLHISRKTVKNKLRYFVSKVKDKYDF